MVFGVWNGQPVPLIEITGPSGQIARVTPFGARLVALEVPDRDGRLGDIVLGHDRLDDYLTHPTYFGATCGRYANRIAGGRFVLDGQPVQLDRNEGANHLHGGSAGFDRQLWRIVEETPTSVRFALTSPDGDMGYPGRMEAEASYAWDEAGQFHIRLTARTDRPTVVNLVNHAYFNLGTGPTILDHQLMVAADHYTPVRADLIPTGEIAAATGAFDFRTPVRIGEALARDPALTGGYDHNWCLRPDADPAVTLCDPASGRGFHLSTNQPGVQIYTCGMMPDGVPGKAGRKHGPFAALTLETQIWPDSPNQPGFPNARLDPGQAYDHRMTFAFFAR